MASNNTRRTNSIPAAPRAVVYARVSSKEQEKEGFSIPAQLKLLSEYASCNGIRVAEEFVDIETAKRSGRTNFDKMIAYLRRHSTVQTLLVEKTDRLYRNLKDWVTIDDLNVEIHFVKEGTVLSTESRSSEKFMHGIKVLMAKNYIDNLSEETRKGMLEKAEQGIWPSCAPLGYDNVEGPSGKRIIEIDPIAGPLIVKLFEWYATGRYSLREIGLKAREHGLAFRRSGQPVTNSTVHKILRNRIYTGEFDWKGKRYVGSHEPLITTELWARVQGVLDARFTSKLRGSSAHDFAFTGLVTCGHCGCAMVGEVKKQKYVYYHCTGFKGNCNEPYTREEVLEQQFAAFLRQLRFDDEVFEWVSTALKESCADEKREHAEAIARLEKERNRLQQRVDAMYIDKLDGRVSEEFYDRMRSQWRDEQARCARDIERHEQADDSYMDEGIELLKLAKDAHRLFEKQPAKEKSQMLNFLLSNCTWAHGKLSAEFKQPFDSLAETAVLAAHANASQMTESGRFEKWLPELRARKQSRDSSLSRMGRAKKLSHCA